MDSARLHEAPVNDERQRQHQQEFDYIELGHVAFDLWLEDFSPRVAIDLRFREKP